MVVSILLLRTLVNKLSGKSVDFLRVINLRQYVPRDQLFQATKEAYKDSGTVSFSVKFLFKNYKENTDFPRFKALIWAPQLTTRVVSHSIRLHSDKHNVATQNYSERLLYLKKKLVYSWFYLLGEYFRQIISSYTSITAPGHCMD